MPLAGIEVEICSSALDWIQQGQTNSQGLCVFKDLPAGSYQVKLNSLKKIAPRKITVSSETAVLRMSMERPVWSFFHGNPALLPVDPAITSFTSSDAKILNEASSSLEKSVVSAWGQISSAADVCERREILIEALENWRGLLEETREKLARPPQPDAKRFMIRTIFNEMIEHLRWDSGSLIKFAQNASRLRVVLGTIANFLKRASESGKATFDLEVVSSPADAHVSYHYPDSPTPIEHSEHTPTTIKGLYFARCIINISFKGHEMYSIGYDPYDSLKDSAHQVRVILLDTSQNPYQIIPSLERRIHESDLIVIGKIQNSQAKKDKTGSDVHTYASVAVEECVKGNNVLKGDNVVIRESGGTIPEEGIFQHLVGGPTILGPAQLNKGERVLLLLKRLPESGYYQVVAGQHGVFSIMNEEIMEWRVYPLKDFIRKIKEIMKSG